MAGVGEIQTISAIFDLLKLSWSAGIFLKKVKDADKIAGELYDRVDRLSKVLDGVRDALQKREVNGVPESSTNSESVELRILDSLEACSVFLERLEDKLGGFGTTGDSTATLVSRFKLAFKYPAISKRQTDLEARISILQTDLAVLQLFDHAHTNSVITSNQTELLQALSSVCHQVENGNRLLKSMVREQRKANVSAEAVLANISNETLQDNEQSAITSLVDCLRTAEDAFERYTSEYIPDDRSIREQDRMIAPSQPLSPIALGTPQSERSAPWPTVSDSDLHSIPSAPFEDSLGSETYTLPLRILNRYIENYRERSRTGIELGHFNQAEYCIDKVAQYSQAREQQHNVAFEDKVTLSEDLAFVYQKQGKWAEAIRKVHELLNNSAVSSEVAAVLVEARQSQLLAAIYFDRHMNSSSGALRRGSNDLEYAEKYAQIAFGKRDHVLESGNPAGDNDEEHDRHRDCMQLLINILEARGKTVEANVFRQVLAEGSSSTTESLMRTSTMASIAPANDYEIVENQHELLLAAIKSGDIEQIQNPASFYDLDVEKLCGCAPGKTLLMQAVECSDESTVHRLLDPIIGANIDARDMKGLTALHLAAAQGQREMVRCLLHHDADIESRDNDGETPLVKAVKSGHRPVVQDLFDKGANMFTKNLARLDEWSLLHHAIHQPTTKMVALLLDLAPDLKNAIDQAGKTPLHHCSDQGKLEHAQVLLGHRNHCDVNAVDSASRTPLYFAASKPATPQREAMVQLLLRYGAHIEHNRLPPRMRDFAALKPFLALHSGTLARHDSVSTEGSVGTVSTSVSRLSRIFSSRLAGRV